MLSAPSGAEKYCRAREVLDAQRRALGPKHPETLETAYRCAVARWIPPRGRTPEAAEFKRFVNAAAAALPAILEEQLKDLGPGACSAVREIRREKRQPLGAGSSYVSVREYLRKGEEER